MKKLLPRLRCTEEIEIIIAVTTPVFNVSVGLFGSCRNFYKMMGNQLSFYAAETSNRMLKA